MPSSTSSSSEDNLPVDVEKSRQEVETPTRASERDVEKQGGDDGVVGGVLQGTNQGQLHDTDQEDDDAIPPEPLDVNAEGMTGTMNRVLSRISTKSSWNPGVPPDGGKEAWLMCLCGHFVIMNTWGFINSFGVFQSYYVTIIDRPVSDISWIGSMSVCLTFFIGTFTGRLTDAGYFKPCLVSGTCFFVLGIFTTSVATEYWQLLLSQGLCVGIGCGLIFCPAITTTSTYFSSKRNLAIGLTACGSVTGGMVYPAMARELLPTVGFGWAVRAIGFVQLTTLVFACIFMKSRLPPRRSGSLIEMGAFKELDYTFFAAGMFCNFWGLYFAFYYLNSFAQTQVSPPLSYVESLNLLLVLNGVGLLGRTIPNYLADTLGPLNLLIPFAFLSGAVSLAWIGVSRPGGLYAWACFYGIVSGGVQSLFPAALSSLTTDLRKQGTRMGMVFTIVSFGTLTGNPIAGAIIGAMEGSYVGAQCFTGLALLMGTALLTVSRIIKIRKRGEGWWIKV